MSSTISGTDLLGRLGHEAQQKLAEGEAAVHHLTGKTEAVRHAWREIGIASGVMRDEAMRIAETNNPVGRTYNQVWKALANTKPGLRDLDKRDRSHAMWLADHWSMVIVWLPTLGSTALTLLHPTSIMRRYDAAHNAPPAVPAGEKPLSPRLALQDQVIRLQTENDLLRKKSMGGLAPGASVNQVTDMIFEAHNTSFVERLMATLAKRLEAERRQDAIETKARRKR